MVLAPFQKQTQVEFNNIKLKEIAVRFLTVVNPLDKHGQVNKSILILKIMVSTNCICHVFLIMIVNIIYLIIMYKQKKMIAVCFTSSE